MKALLIRTHEAPKTIDINNTLADLQKAVDGYIEAVYPFADTVAIVCDEEGKLKGKESNRYLCIDGIAYDMIAGDFLIVGLSDEDFTDLTPEQIKRYTALCYVENIDIDLSIEEMDDLAKIFEGADR